MPRRTSSVRVVNETREYVVAERADVARSLLARTRGLMFTSSLGEGRGLVIDPCGSIHMFGMRYPIDVLYVDRLHRVVRTQRAIRPWRIGPLRTRGARYVIELPVGTIDATGTTTGDQLRLEEVP